jgi:mannitol-specific phosphotransferase system IIBC component
MSDFICKKCGKSYQTPDDLAIHKRFEEGETQYRKISEKNRTDRQRTTPISAAGMSSSTRESSILTQESSNKALDKDTASKMANLLEGLDFPVTKDNIINHIHGKFDNADKETLNDILKLIQNKLQNNVKYNSVYEVEKAANLVVEIK